MKIYQVSEIHTEMKRLGYQIPDFHLVGIRSNEDKSDEFDDLFYVIDVEAKTAFYYNCTTNPGKYYLQNLMNIKGAGVLKPGQYNNAYQRGKHKGLFEALIQVRPVTVIRDKDLDLKSGNSGIEDTGLFGLNIHQPQAVLNFILKSSAGCQVIPRNFSEVLSLCDRSGKKFFTYTLLKEF